MYPRGRPGARGAEEKTAGDRTSSGLPRLNVCEDVAAIIRSEQKTALLITHDISEAISLADRVLVLTARPARVAHSHTLDFGDIPPLKRREQPTFSAWFERLWGELNA